MSKLYHDPRDINDGLFPYSGTKAQQLLFLLKYAILAPSHYNAQPWKFRVNDSYLDCFLDPARVSRISDPHCRESIISCGAAIETAVVAANFFGLATEVYVSPANDSNRLARLKITGPLDPEEDDFKHFHAIKRRQTNRNPFIDIKIPGKTVTDCKAYCDRLNVDFNLTDAPSDIKEFATLTTSATRKQFLNPWYRWEFASWLRSVFSFKRDGLTGFGFFSLNLPVPIAKRMIKSINMGISTSAHNSEKLLQGSPALAIFSTQHDSKGDWINSGRALSHVLLTLTADDFAASFMNQIIQVPVLRPQLKKIFNSQDYPQLVIRVGKAPSVGWTARRQVEECLL